MERPERETGVEEVSRMINGGDRGRVQSGWGVLREQKEAASVRCARSSGCGWGCALKHKAPNSGSELAISLGGGSVAGARFESSEGASTGGTRLD
jgi:hypothetical protein